MPASNSGSAKNLELLDWINDQLTILAEAFGETLTEQRQEIYCSGLADLHQNHLSTAFRRARYELKWFPKLAELRELAGVLADGSNDGRPGVEEAWARMPKGQHMEDDSIVWCKEERIAYGACRSLLVEGDQIGARMAFKERYEREIAQARASARPVQWSFSAGYDVEHRLSTLATAVQERRLSLDTALDFVPADRRTDFAHMLPAAEAKGLLVGQVERGVDLPGLPGLLAKMKVEGVLPDDLKSELPDQKTSTAPMPLHRCDRRQKLKEQAELLKRSRNGSGIHLT